MERRTGWRTGIVGAGLLATACWWAGSSSALAEPPLPLSAVDEAGLALVGRLPLAMPASEAAWAVPAASRVLVDDFEGSPWPQTDRWVQVLDLDGRAGGEYTWSPRDCHPSTGTRALWAVGGGAEGAQLPCGATYPDGAASSALLSLDLTAQQAAYRLALNLDIWADAAPNEGLFVNYVSFDPGGGVRERRTVYSATGRAGGWARGVTLDLTDLHDRADPQWRLDLRGRRAFLEFLFLSVPNQPDGEGIYLDNLYLDSEAEPPPSPTPGGSQTVGCTTGSDCGTLALRGYVDGRCDGRYQPGLDTPLRGARVDVAAGSVALGSSLTKSGNASFRVPLTGGVTVRLMVPDGYAPCPNSSDSFTLSAKDFKPFGRKQQDFRVTRRR